MDSVENIRKNRRKLLAYSIILLIVGLFLGFSGTFLFKPSNNSSCDKIAVASKTNNNFQDNDNYAIIAENLLGDYMRYYNSLLINEEKISYNNREANLVISSFEELNKIFTSDITLDKLYNYYDYGNMSLPIEESNKPVYTQVNDLYYFDGACDSTGNKLIYSDFKVVERKEDTIKLSYLVTVMSIVDNTIMETNTDDVMTIKLEDGSWKINSASIIGRCGLPYSVS